ncbi:MAG: hypothetical protein K2J25_07765, partial [Oscillospiraceae bacterium]|nr:hypothetical protein [Oscillospiraceae bacterium]
MICSKEDKFRAVTLTVVKNSDDSLLDDSAIHAVHSMKSLVDTIENNEHAKGWYEQDEIFMGMRGNLYPIYRPFYIRRILHSLGTFAEDKPLLKVNSKLHEIYEEAKCIFGSYAETELVSDEKEFFIYENEKLFCAVILSGIVLCCKEPQQRQKLEITLHCTDNEATILINMTALKEMRKDWKVQGSTQCYTKTSGEEKLLNMFCGRHNGSWNLLDSNENNEISTCCKITFQSDEVSKLRFNSPSISVTEKEKFFNIYHAM